MLVDRGARVTRIDSDTVDRKSRDPVRNENTLGKIYQLYLAVIESFFSFRH